MQGEERMEESISSRRRALRGKYAYEEVGPRRGVHVHRKGEKGDASV
jgi:hypothetical protein